MWLEHHSEMLQSICKLHQLCHRYRWVGCRFQAGKLVLMLHIPKVFSRAFKGACLHSWDMHVLQW